LSKGRLAQVRIGSQVKFILPDGTKIALIQRYGQYLIEEANEGFFCF